MNVLGENGRDPWGPAAGVPVARMSLAEMTQLGMELLLPEFDRVVPGDRTVDVAAFNSSI